MLVSVYCHGTVFAFPTGVLSGSRFAVETESERKHRFWSEQAGQWQSDWDIPGGGAEKAPRLRQLTGCCLAAGLYNPNVQIW